MPAGEEEGQRSYLLIAAILCILLALIIIIGAFTYQGLNVPADPQSRPGFNLTGLDSKPDPSDVFPGGQEDPQLYARRIPVDYQNGTQISVLERAGAEDPNYGSLVSLLRDDRTERGTYTEDVVCSNFAVQLHDNMERSGIDAHLVLIEFEDGGIPHLIVAINTTDKGMVYVDDTGLTREQQTAGLLARDRIVDLVPGEPYHTRFLPPYDEVEDRIDLGVVKSVEFIT